MKLALVLVGVVALPSLAAADDWQLHQSFTFEAAGGAGEFVAYSGDYGTGFSHGDVSALALHFGVGGFVRPRLAVTGQLVTNTFLHAAEDGTGTYTATLFGPGVQVWLLPELWVGGGLGLVTVSGDSCAGHMADDAFGCDLRAGITRPTTTQNAFSFQIEALPTLLDSNYVGFSALVGYQYL